MLCVYQKQENASRVEHKIMRVVSCCTWEYFKLISGDCKTNISVSNLTASDAICNMDSTCNKIECCFSIPDLLTNLRVVFHIQTCEMILVVGIEERKHIFPLKELNWGKDLKCECMTI